MDTTFYRKITAQQRKIKEKKNGPLREKTYIICIKHTYMHIKGRFE